MTDDVAGHAYVEEFGLDTFQRAENAIVANKATLFDHQLPSCDWRAECC